MSEIKDLTEKLLKFRADRNWQQFHNPKDMALSLVLEATEVMEHFQWKTPKEIEEYLAAAKEDIGEELADVLNWVLLMSHDLGLDIIEVMEKKIKKNELKYPIEKAKGRALKYDRL
jgi:NTP pyrophosphatase (non-canonical NTP hydrolase)